MLFFIVSYYFPRAQLLTYFCPSLRVTLIPPLTEVTLRKAVRANAQQPLQPEAAEVMAASSWLQHSRRTLFSRWEEAFRVLWANVRAP